MDFKNTEYFAFQGFDPINENPPKEPVQQYLFKVSLEEIAEKSEIEEDLESDAKLISGVNIDLIKTSPEKPTIKQIKRRVLIGAIASGAIFLLGYTGVKMKQDSDRIKAKKEYEERHAYDFTPEEVKRLYSIENNILNRPTFLDSLFGSKKTVSEEEKEFKTNKTKRLDNIIKNPEIAISRLSYDEKREFDGLSRKYENMISRYKDFSKELEKVKEERSKHSTGSKVITTILTMPFTFGIDVLFGIADNKRGLQTTESLIGNSLKSDPDEEKEKARVEEIYKMMVKRQEEFETERKEIKRTFNHKDHEFDYNTGSGKKADIDKLLYFYYSRGIPTLVKNYKDNPDRK